MAVLGTAVLGTRAFSTSFHLKTIKPMIENHVRQHMILRAAKAARTIIGLVVLG